MWCSVNSAACSPLAQPHQRGAQHRPGGEVEGPQRLLARRGGAARSRARLPRQPGEVDERQRRRGRLADHLHRPPPGEGEGGAQGLVPAHDLGQARRQRSRIENALHP